MIPLYIFDIDGTISNLEHRLHLITKPLAQVTTTEFWKPDWDEFHRQVKLDKPIDNVIKTLRYLASYAEIWFFTGRMETCRQATINWIYDNVRSGPVMVEMRGIGDYRPDWQVKQGMLDNMLDIDFERLVAVFDDRQQVVDMWRRNGITCFQCAKGDF